MLHHQLQLRIQEAGHTKTNQKQSLAEIQFIVQELERKITKMSPCLKKLSRRLLRHHFNHNQCLRGDLELLGPLRKLSLNHNLKLKQEVDLNFINLMKSL